MMLLGRLIEYEIYDIYKAKQTDMSCISQDTRNLRVITLITCDSIDDSFRTVVKAKEI